MCISTHSDRLFQLILNAEVYPGRDGKVSYDEGVFVGYRHYDRSGTVPLYAFGHGLSYTSFAMSDLQVVGHADGARVSFTVTNTGAREGSTVAQVYVGDIEATVPRPVRELKAFRKLVLEPGQSTVVEIALPLRAFAFFDVVSQCWRVEAGRFTIFAGFSAMDIAGKAELALEAATLSV